MDSNDAGAARPRIKSVQFHPSMGAMAAQVSAASPTTGPHVLMWSMSDESHPLAGSLSGAVTRLHTSLEFWGVQQGTERCGVRAMYCCFLSGLAECYLWH